MSMISPALARSPIARFSPEELAYWGDGLVRNAGGQPIEPLSGGRVLTRKEVGENLRHEEESWE